MKGFLELFLIEKTATLNLRPSNDLWLLMSLKALRRLSGDVSVGNVSKTAPGLEERKDLAKSFNGSGLLARRATAMFP